MFVLSSVEEHCEIPLATVPLHVSKEFFRLRLSSMHIKMDRRHETSILVSSSVQDHLDQVVLRKRRTTY